MTYYFHGFLQHQINFTIMAKTQEKKKISQKSKDLNFIKLLKINKKVKEELIKLTKSKKNGLNRSMNRKLVLKKK